MNLRRIPVTILVPVFNGSKHIKSGLNSIIKMANKSDEVLIIDDGSNDDSMSQIMQFARSYENINFISRQHFGLVDTLNFGIRESANTLIARADIDDLYSPKRIQRQVELMSTSTNLSAVFSDYQFISEEVITTKFGQINTYHIAKSSGDAEEKTDVWLAEDYRFIPIKILKIAKDGSGYEFIATRIDTDIAK